MESKEKSLPDKQAFLLTHLVDTAFTENMRIMKLFSKVM